MTSFMELFSKEGNGSPHDGSWGREGEKEEAEGEESLPAQGHGVG